MALVVIRTALVAFGLYALWGGFSATREGWRTGTFWGRYGAFKYKEDRHREPFHFWATLVLSAAPILLGVWMIWLAATISSQWDTIRNCSAKIFGELMGQSSCMSGGQPASHSNWSG